METTFNPNDPAFGAAGSVDQQEWQQFLKRHNELVNMILGETMPMGQDFTAQQALAAQQQRGQPQQQIPMLGSQQTGISNPRPAALDEMLGQAHFYGISGAEQMSPAELEHAINQRRAEMPLDQQTSLGSTGMALLGLSSEAATATSRIIGNMFGGLKELPFVGPTLASIAGTEKAKRYMYDLSQKTSEFTEAARMSQPLQDQGAFQVMAASGKVAGYALPALTLWNAIGAAGGWVPPAWAARVASPIARAALQGGLTSGIMEAGSDESTQSKVFNVGLGMFLGGASALPIVGASLGFGALGYGVGSQVGDTPEERQRHAIEGAIAGATMGALPIVISAGFKVRNDIPGPVDQAVNEQVKLLPSGESPAAAQRRQATATMVQQPQDTGPDYTVGPTNAPPQPGPTLQVRAEAPLESPRVFQSPEQQQAPQVQGMLPRPSEPPAMSAQGGKLDGTKVVDQSGQPLTVYHGTGTDFESFDLSKADPEAMYGPGFYHTENPDVAAGYAGQTSLPGMYQQFPGDARYPNIKPAKLNIQNPFEAEKDYQPHEVAEIIDRMEFAAPGYNWDLARAQPWMTQNNMQGQALYELMAVTPSKDPVQGPWGQPHELLSNVLTHTNVGTNIPIGKAGLNAALERIGYDGITHEGGQITNGVSHKVWIAFRPDQVHSPWDVAPVDTQGAAAQADAMSKQATLMESQTLPQAVVRTQLTDADVVSAAYTANPGGISLIRGLTNPMSALQSSDNIRFVRRGDQFDALVGPATDQHVADYEKYGVFNSQNVVTASGIEGYVTGFSKGLIKIKQPGKNLPLFVRPENVLPSRTGVPVVNAPDIYQELSADVMRYMNADSTDAGLPPVASMTDPRVGNLLSYNLSQYLDDFKVTDPAARQAIEADVNHRWVQEFKALDPEMDILQSNMTEAATVAHNESEGSYQDYLPTSIEEKAQRRGFTFIANPGDGGAFKDVVNPGSPDIPVQTDAGAHEFLARVDRTLPDYTPTADVPMEVADHLPADMGVEPSLPIEHQAESLSNSIYQMNGELTPEYIAHLNTNEGQNQLAQRLLSTDAQVADFRRQWMGESGNQTPTPAGTGGGGSIVPPVAPPPAGGGGQGALPPGPQETLGGQFDRMRRSDPEKLHNMVNDFQSLTSSRIRYMRYGMLSLEKRLADSGIDLGTAWQHYEALDTARSKSFNEGTPWVQQWGSIMRQFPRRILRDGTVTRIHELTDPNARAAAWWRLQDSHGLNDRQVQQAMKADAQITDFMHRFAQTLSDSPQINFDMDREIFQYMPHVRARQAQGVPDPYDTGSLNPDVQFFGEHVRENNMQFRVMDARELGNTMVRAAMFKKYEAEPWKNLVDAWQDPRIPEPMKDFMLDWARLVRQGYDPRGELAVRGIQSVMKHVGVPLTAREAQHILNIPAGAMYMSMLGGRMSIFFRDATQPLLALAKVRMPYMADTYKKILLGTKSSITKDEENVLRDMYHRGLDSGWIEKENPNIEAASIYEEQGGQRTNELLHMSQGQQDRREMLARLGDQTYQLPAWLSRPMQSNLSTLKWYGREGQLHRLIVGESAYQQAKDNLAQYRQSTIDAVGAMDPSKEMPYSQLEEQSFFGSFEKPIRNKLKALVDSGDDEEASQLFAREVANWSQFRYGKREVPPVLRNNIGRMLWMFGNFTGQFLEGMASSLSNGSPMHKARYGMTVGMVSSAMYLMKHVTGWSFDKWAWVPSAAFQYAGGPLLEKGANAMMALQGGLHQGEGAQVTDPERAAMKDEVKGGMMPAFSDFFPYTGYVRSASEYASAAQGTNPFEQAARYTIVGDRGSRIDMQREIENMAAKQDIMRGQITPGALSPNGGQMPGGPGGQDEFHYPQGGQYQFPHGTTFPGAGAQ